MGHRPALDGIRGLAILGVVLLHSSIWGDVPRFVPGGNLGVTVFFVLSGYLITRLMLEEHERTGQIDLRSFYLRRAARLLPGMLVLLPVYVLVFSSKLSPSELLLTVGCTLLYLSSFVQAIWGAMGNLSWTWSLSVEEHFYACWPPVLRWLLNAPAEPRPGLRGRLRRHPLALASAIAVLIVALATILRISLVGSAHWNDFDYYSTFTRMDALAVGALAALAGHRRRLAPPAVVGWLALGVIVWCYLNPAFAIGGVSLDLYGLPLCTAAAAVLILTAVNRPSSLFARALSIAPLTNLGRVSYGLYLWNLLPGQTFHLVEGRHPGLVGTILCAIVMFAVVELSFWYVEQPVQRWARERLRKRSRRGRAYAGGRLTAARAAR
jgi:peptidoglycan/LPS O-acetylase OafA/YrhL